MNDETKAELMKRTREWLQSCVNAATRSGVPEEADLEAFILAHLDGEPARLAAALENMREACALRVDAVKCYGYGVEADEPGVRDQCAGEVRDTPLDATPLADALERANEGVRYWTDLAQAEARDAAALRARVAELEAEVESIRTRLRPHFGKEVDQLQPSKLVADLEAEWQRRCRGEEKAEAQVAAARAGLTKIARFDEGDEVCGSFDEPGSTQVARDALREMDEAAK